MTILDEIAAYAKIRVAEDQKNIQAGRMKDLAESLGRGEGNVFYDAVSKQGMSFICEIKKASPSKGIIDPVFDYPAIAKAYNEAGVDAVSCLTEPKWFQGSDEIFQEVRGIVKAPMIRKDFIVDEYQIYQARVMGANCVLLICSILDTDTISRYLGICEDLGLAALVETHDAEEIGSAVSAGAKMIGVNNRNLKDFSVDFSNASRLRDLIPSDRLYVAESGVSKASDIAELVLAGADAVLVGEAMMRAENKKEFLTAMRAEAAKI